jgi:deoxyribodipyrimidine photo-lyase
VKERGRILQNGIPGEGPVAYWMNRDQRVEDNWALLEAQKYALLNKKPLLVVFCLTPHFLSASYRAYHFMLHGLHEVRQGLLGLNIPFILLEQEAPLSLPNLIKKIDVSALFTDFSPLRIKKEWVEQIKKDIAIPFYEIDAHNIVPCWEASTKKEYSARTFRPRILKKVPDFLTPIPSLIRHPYNETLALKTAAPLEMLTKYHYPQKTLPLYGGKAGYTAGMECLQKFIKKKLRVYKELRNDPTNNVLSQLSPFLHFGQIAPQRVAIVIKKHGENHESIRDSVDSFLEELIVRRELADNFCFYTPSYDCFEGFPQWAQKTLDEHRWDPRKFTYTLEELEHGKTHDQLWDACQLDILFHGKLHSWLRMYWAKKILEWSKSPEEAMKAAIYLNDCYEIDGRDPNGYAGIAWSIGGVHDRAWPERQIFGKIRYMNDSGAKRKFHVKQYIESITSNPIGQL